MKVVKAETAKRAFKENGYYIKSSENVIKVRRGSVTLLEIVYLEEASQIVFITEAEEDTIVLPVFLSEYVVEWEGLVIAHMIGYDDEEVTLKVYIR